jgi:hypothetical protein
LRDVTRELLDFCAPLWAADPQVAAHAFDLAVHESLRIEISALPAPNTARTQPESLSLEEPVELSSALRLVNYAHAVHELPDDVDDASLPAARPVSLLVYRSHEDEVRYLELNPVAAAIMAQLVEQKPLGLALTNAARACGLELDQSLLEGSAKLLADLAERGVLRGPFKSEARREQRASNYEETRPSLAPADHDDGRLR